MSHLKRIKYGLSSLFVSDLLIFCIRYGVEQNGSCFVMILEGHLLIIRHLASGDSFSFSILGMLIAFNDDIPQIYIKAKKKTFYSVLPVFKFLTIKDGRFCTVSIVFVFRRTSHWVFHTPRIGTETLLGVAIRTGALIPIEGVKNTRRGGLNWVFKTKNFFPLFLSRKSFQN